MRASPLEVVADTPILVSTAGSTDLAALDRATAAAAAGARIVIVSGSVGAGHDGVAHELADRLRERGHPVAVLDMLDGFPLLVRILLSSAYVLTIRLAPWVYESTCWLVERSRVFQRLADAICCSAAGWLAEATVGADLIVATYPPAGRALGRLKRTQALAAPVVTYLTDPAPNYLWVHPDVDLHLTASQATAAETEATYGIPVEAAGPLVARAFRVTDRAGARSHLETALGVPPAPGSPWWCSARWGSATCAQRYGRSPPPGCSRSCCAGATSGCAGGCSACRERSRSAGATTCRRCWPAPTWWCTTPAACR